MRDCQALLHPTRDLDSMVDDKETYSCPCAIRSKDPQTHTCDIPKCASCILSKMRRVSKSTTCTQGVPLGKLTQNDMLPGQCVSMDQYIIKEKGRPLHTASNTDE
eukprot:12344699-Ditylum_brightwellii.AAC.1